MALTKFSIQIDKAMKTKLEDMAKENYRSLNGEINKALDFYIKYNDMGENMGFNTLINHPKEPKRTLIEQNSSQEEQISMNINDFDEEVDEF